MIKLYLMLIVSVVAFTACDSESPKQPTHGKNLAKCDKNIIRSTSDTSGYFCTVSNSLEFTVSGKSKSRWENLRKKRYREIEAKDLVVSSKVCGSVTLRLELGETESRALIDSIEKTEQCMLRENDTFLIM